jgi:hypothetical protein
MHPITGGIFHDGSRNVEPVVVDSEKSLSRFLGIIEVIE